MAHGKWSEVEARGVIDAWQKSGMPLETFAKERGIVGQRLRWWRLKLTASDAQLALSGAATTAGSEVPAVLPLRVAPEGGKRGEPVTVLLRTGHMLKVSHGFDEGAFARVVALLEGR